MMESKKSYTTWILLLGALVGSVALYFLFRRFKNSQEEMTPENEEPDSADYLPVDKFREIESIASGEGYSLNMCKYITAQSMHETADFTSGVYRTNHNMFGMRQPSKRETTSLGAVGGYASYASDEDSIRDMLLYLDYVGCPKDFATIKEYIQFLKSKSYFTDTFANYLGNNSMGATGALNRLNTEIAVG